MAAKKIYLINCEEPYVRGNFAASANKHEVPFDTIDLKEVIFHISEGSTKLYSNNCLIDPLEAYFFIRRKADDSYFCYLLTEYLHHLKVPYLDECNRSHNALECKISQLIRLTPKGVPFPESFVCRPYAFELHQRFILDRISFPCVFKRSGARGEKVWLIDSKAALAAKIAESPREPFILQQYIANEFDLRVIVFEDRIVGSMKRSSVDGFANTASDAVLEPYELSAAETQLALESAKAADLDLAGVDIVHTNEGLKVWEINSVPQLHRFDAALDISAMDFIISQIKERYLTPS